MYSYFLAFDPVVRIKVHAIPSAEKLTVTHHDEFHEPVIITTHASNDGPKKFPTLNICCISPITAATEPSGGARTTTRRHSSAGTVPPIKEKKKEQMSCPVSHRAVGFQSIAKNNRDVMAIAMNVATTMCRIWAPLLRRRPAISAPITLTPPTTADNNAACS